MLALDEPMGRQSRLKRERQLERLAEDLEEGEFETDRKLRIHVHWGVRWAAICVTVIAALLSVGTERQESTALAVLLVSGGLGFLARHRGDRERGRSWLILGTAWYLAMLFIPSEWLGQFIP